MAGPPADYVDVPTRIREFYEKYPDGRLTSARPPWVEVVDGRSFVVYGALAWRTPDDPRPGEGWAWEPVPGPTPFTRDSELMNAETSAWGRAIASLGFSTKIATEEEVLARQGNAARRPVEIQTEPAPSSTGADGKAEAAQHRRLHAIIRDLEGLSHRHPPVSPQGKVFDSWDAYVKWAAQRKFGVHSRADLDANQMTSLIGWVESELETARVAEDIPFG